MSDVRSIRVAIIDLYNNEPNEGMRCLRDVLSETGRKLGVTFTTTEYETRFRGETPGVDHDIYLSSGGPGSPFEGEGTAWELSYFRLLEDIWDHNQRGGGRKKFMFFICHSFQMMSRFFRLADVTRRETYSFGVLPVQRTDAGARDPVMKDLTNPFYAADFRQYQVVQPRQDRLKELGAKILSWEIVNGEASREPSVMALRVSPEIVGTQFHPEADPLSMLKHFNKPERKKQAIDAYGETAYVRMIDQLESPENITLTRKTVLPSFLGEAVGELLRP
jgi:homoserine O-succinyltransferase